MSDRTHDAAPTGEAGARAAAELDRASLADKYDRMMRLADLFDRTGREMRERTELGRRILADEAVTGTGELSPQSWAVAEEDVRGAFRGKHGLETHALELDADGLVVRATVLTYRWIDELQEAAYRTLGTIAGRAIGYLAPEVELGGAIVSAGLIETDALDREGVAAYLDDLAANNPDLMEHVSSGGGGLLEGLQMRSLLSVSALAGPEAAAASRGGLRAIGVPVLEESAGAALRDSAGPALTAPPEDAPEPVATADGVPRNLEELIGALTSSGESVAVHEVAPRQFIAYLTGPAGQGRLRLVGADTSAWTAGAVRAIRAATAGDGPARVMLVGCGGGGAAAAEIAAAGPDEGFTVDQVVTVGAPAGAVPVIPDATRVLSLEDRRDPVALLGSLINQRAANRLTVVYDGGETPGHDGWLAGSRAADAAAHETLRTEIRRLQELGYLAG